MLVHSDSVGIYRKWFEAILAELTNFHHIMGSLFAISSGKPITVNISSLYQILDSSFEMAFQPYIVKVVNSTVTKKDTLY